MKNENLKRLMAGPAMDALPDGAETKEETKQLLISTNARMIVEYLFNPELAEATVRRPPRSSRWVAVFSGPEPGKQVWRSTGLTDRDAALALARRREAQAQRLRAASGALTKKPTIRVRRGSGEAAAGLLNQEEVAALLGLSVRAVREIERRAFAKLRRHPALRRFWREHASGDVEEACIESSNEFDLTNAEITALFARTRSTVERQALRKLLGLIRA